MATVLRNLTKFLFLTFLLSIYFSISYAQLENTSQPEVTITILQGTLRGRIVTTSHDRNISAFLGIPYAQPPIGDLRFANPKAADGWNGTRDASSDGIVCPQTFMNVITGEEDCLFLNVYTPQLPESTSSSLLPVMVYVHGGGFFGGSGTFAVVGPEYILNEDVLLVALNYRLGALGWLSTGDEVAPGNLGLKDQVLALQWIHDNIEYFGGDPDQVTLFGESAGAAAVDFLTLTNATNGLFHRCITQSGSAAGKQFFEPRTIAATRAFELGEYLGCSNDTSDPLINCLRTVDFTDIAQYSESIFWGATDEPDIDGAFFTDSPTNLIAAGKIRDIPQISGVCRDEGLLETAAYYEDEAAFLDFLENIDTLLPSVLEMTDQPDSGAAWLAAIKSYYFNNDLTSNTSAVLTNLTLLVGDSWFYYPAYSALQQRLTAGINPQYSYIFNYQGTFSYNYIYVGATTSYGVTHGDDLTYLFPSSAAFSDLNETMSEADLEMVDIMVQLWTSFAINGTPTTSALNGVTWEPYSTEQSYYFRIGNESDITSGLEYISFEDRMQFWARLEAGTETSTEAENSGAMVSSSANLLIVLMLVCSKLLVSAAIADGMV